MSPPTLSSRVHTLIAPKGGNLNGVSGRLRTCPCRSDNRVFSISSTKSGLEMPKNLSRESLPCSRRWRCESNTSRCSPSRPRLRRRQRSRRRLRVLGARGPITSRRRTPPRRSHGPGKANTGARDGGGPLDRRYRGGETVSDSSSARRSGGAHAGRLSRAKPASTASTASGPLIGEFLRDIVCHSWQLYRGYHALPPGVIQDEGIWFFRPGGPLDAGHG